MNLTLLCQAALQASWQASFVILLILLLRPLLGLRVPARWRYLLWSLVLLRLLVPAFLLPRSPASYQNLPMVDRPLETAGLSVATGPAPAHRQSQGPEEGDTVAAIPSALPATPRSWWPLIAAVWLTGFLGLGLAVLTLTWRLGYRLRREASAVEESLALVWERCCAGAFPAAGRSWLPLPRLARTDAIGSPALVGLLHPLLLLPRQSGAELSTDDWEHIFLHELAHFRRRDHWVQPLLLGVLCLHWFNPLVWLGFRCLRADRELAADEWALRHLESLRSVSYGETLLKILSSPRPHLLAPGLVGILEDGAQMRQRLRHIVAFGPRRFAGSLAGIALALGLAAVVLARPTVDLSAYEGLSPEAILVTAAGDGDRTVVEQQLVSVDVNAMADVKGERTALNAAVEADRLELVRLLVEKGASVQRAPEKGDAPLVVALKKGWPECATYLVNQGATCPPELLAAARGDASGAAAFLAASHPDFAQLRTLCEIAASNGQAALFSTLYDAILALPDRSAWESGHGLAAVAIVHGHRAVVEEMLRRGESLNRDRVMRLAPLVEQTAGMRAWLQAKGFIIPEYTAGEQLIEATEHEDLPGMRRALGAGAEIDYHGESGWTPLTKAATWGCPRAVKLLLEHHADPNARKLTGDYTALSLAKTTEIADQLFAAGARVNPDDLSYCVMNGPLSMVKWYLGHGADPVSYRFSGGETLLFHANSPEIAELLLGRGVDVHARNRSGQTALDLVLQYKKDPALGVTTLLRHGADPNERDSDGSTPLMRASDAATVEVLLAAGADPQARDDRGEGVLAFRGSPKADRLDALLRHGLVMDKMTAARALTEAVQGGNTAEVRSLLARGVDPSIGTRWEGRLSETPLCLAVVAARFGIAALLRAGGANDVGPLSEAAAQGDVPRMEALLGAGASVNESSATGARPLEFAAYQGQGEAVRWLLDHGAEVSAFDVRGDTAETVAETLLSQINRPFPFTQIRRLEVPRAKQILEEILATIRERHPDPAFRNRAGETALMCAARNGSVYWHRNKAGEPINAQRSDGTTALMLAVAGQPRETGSAGPATVVAHPAVGADGAPVLSMRARAVKQLLDQGADLSLRNQDGRTALDLAREYGNAEILSLLQAAQTKSEVR